MHDRPVLEYGRHNSDLTERMAVAQPGPNRHQSGTSTSNSPASRPATFPFTHNFANGRSTGRSVHPFGRSLHRLVMTPRRPLPTGQASARLHEAFDG